MTPPHGRFGEHGFAFGADPFGMRDAFMKNGAAFEIPTAAANPAGLAMMGAAAMGVMAMSAFAAGVTVGMALAQAQIQTPATFMGAGSYSGPFSGAHNG